MRQAVYWIKLLIILSALLERYCCSIRTSLLYCNNSIIHSYSKMQYNTKTRPHRESFSHHFSFSLLPYKTCNLTLCVFLSIARRLAMYQEADSEEEETAAKGGTLSQRNSVSSHQSIKAVHRSLSMKSHRRTGSRAEAKRASILSKHTAFSSPMVRCEQQMCFALYLSESQLL